MIPLGIVAAIYASFTLALAIAAIKKSYREEEPSVSFLFNAFFGLVLWVPLALVFGAKISDFPTVLPYAIVSALLSEALYFYALSKGQLSITSILLGSYPIYTVLFSILINHEILTPIQYVFVGLTIGGTLISYLPSKLTMEELKKSGALFWPIFAALGVGFSDALSKHVINQTSSFSFLLALAFVQIPVALVYLKVEKGSVTKILSYTKRNVHLYKFPILGAIFNIIGTGLLWLSFNYTYASIASPITATSGALVVLFAAIFLDERLALKNILGLILISVGVFGISALSR
ncbi:DMT family transporter [Candidatus Gottesmanbacteria bacterium]|nr:DMT family transporter [Candidatus Gottesmanbacteria bacterium]